EKAADADREKEPGKRRNPPGPQNPWRRDRVPPPQKYPEPRQKRHAPQVHQTRGDLVEPAIKEVQWSVMFEKHQASSPEEDHEPVECQKVRRSGQTVIEQLLVKGEIGGGRPDLAEPRPRAGLAHVISPAGAMLPQPGRDADGSNCQGRRREEI